MKKIAVKAGLTASILILFTGCTNPFTPPPPPTETDQNELFIYTVWPDFYVREDVFDRHITQFVKNKFPNVKIKHVAWDDGKRYEDLIAAGTIPDIIMDDSGLNMNRYIIDNDLHFDMRELIKKHNFDTNLLDQPSMNRMRNVTKEGDIYGLPFQISDYILYYNIDVFDKFGADYPKLGMTYDEAYELAKKLTRVEDDISYKGYSQHPGHYMDYNQLSLHPLHPDENRAVLTTEGWAKLTNNLLRFQEIPGANRFGGVERFTDGNMAMAVAVVERIVEFHERNPNLNFDISTVPFFSDRPGVRYQPNVYSMYITKQSEKKDLAFQVMQYLLSEEYQVELAKEGVIGPLQTEAVQQAFGQNLPHMQGKNTEAIFYGDYAEASPARTPGLTNLQVHTYGIFVNIGDGMDTITSLRTIEEAANKALNSN